MCCQPRAPRCCTQGRAFLGQENAQLSRQPKRCQPLRPLLGMHSADPVLLNGHCGLEKMPPSTKLTIHLIPQQIHSTPVSRIDCRVTAPTSCTAYFYALPVSSLLRTHLRRWAFFNEHSKAPTTCLSLGQPLPTFSNLSTSGLRRRFLARLYSQRAHCCLCGY
ncbi:hypothetical protein BC567DRAFT_237520 [Phyllosticta citribraziliensis]